MDINARDNYESTGNFDMTVLQVEYSLEIYLRGQIGKCGYAMRLEHRIAPTNPFNSRVQSDELPGHLSNI